jgi:hypothetical protein
MKSCITTSIESFQGNTKVGDLVYFEERDSLALVLEHLEFKTKLMWIRQIGTKKFPF